MKPMKDKVALVTGGSQGIGKAVSMALAQNGASVVVTDIVDDKGKQTINAIKDIGGDAIYINTDVSNIDNVKYTIQETIDRYGRLDFAVNNAGIEGKQAPTAECTAENWQKVIKINLTGLWYCMNVEIPEMLKNKGGAIVNMSSVAGRVGFLNIPAYTASKHGVIGLTKTAALEYAEQNIRVNAVCPGVIHTAMIDRFTGGDEEAIKNMAGMQPVNRMGTPEEVASLVVFLCSDDASFITGESIAIDGAFTAR